MHFAFSILEGCDSNKKVKEKTKKHSLPTTSCRDRDDEPSAGSGKLITVSRLHISINGMQSAAETNAARSPQTGTVHNSAQTHNAGDTRNSGITRADGTPIENPERLHLSGIPAELKPACRCHHPAPHGHAQLRHRRNHWHHQPLEAGMERGGTGI